MTITKLSWLNLLNNPLNSILSLLLMIFGVGIISLLLLLNNQVENANALINNKYNEKGETKEIKYSHQPSEEIKGQ